MHILVFFEMRCLSKIDDLNGQTVSTFNQNILRFQVSMNNTSLVAIIDCLENLLDDDGSMFLREEFPFV